MAITSYSWKDKIVHAGARYEGEWLADVRHGEGRLCLPDGDWTAGQWIRGDLPAGSGAHRAAASQGPPIRIGYEYEGGLTVRVRRLPVPGAESSGAAAAVHGAGLGGIGLSRELQLEWIRAGNGHCRYTSGKEWYRGEWAAGRREGQGRAEFDDGGSFEGRWAADRPVEGRGRLLGPTASTGANSDCADGGGDRGGGWIYEGDLAGGLRHGRGACTWPDGTAYDGEWRAGRRWGTGRLCGPGGGRRYDGEWADDLRSGGGLAAAADGDAGGLAPAVLPLAGAAGGGAPAVRYDGRFALGLAAGSGRGAYADGSRSAHPLDSNAFPSPLFAMASSLDVGLLQLLWGVRGGAAMRSGPARVAMGRHVSGLNALLC